MTTHCYAMVRGSVARFTRLDARGSVVEGERSVIVTKGISEVSINETSTSRSHDLLRSETDDPRILLRGFTETTGFEADINLCGVDPELISMLTGQPYVENYAGDIVGNDAKVRLPVANFAMEVWSKLAQPVNGYTYGYTVFPRLRGGRIGGFGFGANAVNFTIKGARTSRASRWGVGPYSLRWTGDGWDMGGWDTNPWDTPYAAPSCALTPVPPLEEGFGLDAFGIMPFGGGDWVGPVTHERLGEPIGHNTHWRNFLLDWAPNSVCGAWPLYDVIDNRFASPATQTDDVVDGQFVFTSADQISGGWA